MKKILLSLFALLTCMVSAQADGFEVDGISYNVMSEPWDENPGEVYVTSKKGGYSGDITIPGTVTPSKTYKVMGIEWQAFKDCTKLTSVTIKDGMTDIGGEAFSGCSKLTSVTIPNSVTSIGYNAFCDCSKLTDVTLSDQITSIEGSTFQNCTSLTTITIPDGVTVIHGSAFSGCEKLSSITIPNSVEKIEGSVFYNCSKLTSVDLSNITQTTIEWGTFQNCTSLTSITIPDDVEVINGYAFAGCTNLTSITIPSNLTKIGEYAFNGCEKLSSAIVLPNSVEKIGNEAFRGCSKLTSIDISGCQLTAIESNTFNGCTSLSSITIPDDVTVIGEWAFSSCTGLTTVTLPNSLEIIGNYAFYGCENLSSPITLPNSVEKIGNDAFSGCSKLTSIDISGCQLTTIESNTFDGCKNLASVTIPSSVTKIGGWAFHDCFALTSIEIPNGVTEIGENAFWNCNKLTSVTIPGSVEKIGENAFLYCGSLKQVTSEIETPFKVNAFDGVLENAALVVPKDKRADYKGTEGWNFGLIFEEGETICDRELTDEQGIIYTLNQADDNSLYYSVTGYSEELKSEVVIPDEIGGTAELKGFPVTTIEGQVFTNCKALTKITIPNSVKKIGWWAFQNCYNLTSVILSDQLTTIEEGVFNGCSSLMSIIIPNSVTSIGRDAFSGCNKLSSVILSDQLTTIEDNAFNGCGLTSITIPSSVTTIGNWAFGNCNSVTKVISEILEPKEVEAFNWWYSNATLVVPKGLIETYKSLSGWNEFAFTIEEGGTVYDKEQTDKQGIRYELKQAEDYSVYYAVATCTDDVKKDIVIPTDLDGCPVTTVESWAFSGRSITSITIPNSITDMKESAFRGISGLQVVTSEILTPVEVNAFDWWNGDVAIALVVPKDKRPDYKSVSGWKDAAFIFEEGETIYQVSRIDDQGVRYELRLAEDNSVYYAVATCTDDVKKEIVIPTDLDGCPVTTVDSWAFSGRSITSITIPNSITNMKESAFKGISGLQVVTSEILVPFEVDAFDWWNGEIALVVPKDKRPDYKSVNGWKDCLFIFEVGEEVVISKTGVADEEQGVYYSLRQTEDNKSYYAVTSNNDQKRTELVIRTDIDGVPVKSIEDWVFSNCEGLTSLTIPNSIENIGNYAFYNCTGLTSLEIPNNVTTIGENAFYSCKNITSITFYNGVENMGNGAFDGCYSLNDLTIKVSDDAKFCNNNILKVFNNPIDYWDSEKQQSVRHSFNIHIIDSNGNDIKDYVIPESVTTIGDGAFKGYTALSSITIPNSVTSIGDAAFKGCTGLSSINIPNSVTSIGSETFRDCGNIESVKMGKNVSSIGDNAFYNCTSLNSITLPKKLESIGSGVFSGEWSESDYRSHGCPITSIAIPHSVKTIGNDAFRYCRELTLVSFETDDEGKTSLTSIGDWAFSECFFSSITIPNSVTTIGKGAFENNDSLTTVIIGDGITEIKENTFQDCNELTSVTIPNKVTSIGNFAFRYCWRLNSIKLPESLTTMGENVFEGCQLKSIELPDAFTVIPDKIFEKNDLGYIKLGKNVKSIGKNAFGSQLHENEEGGVLIVIDTPTPPAIDKNAFPNYSYLSEINVIVPDAKAEEAYSKAAVWLDMTYANMENEAVVTVNEEGKLSKETLTQCGLYPTKVVNLKVKGSINAEDFDQMRVNMKSLLSLDLSECDITAIPDSAMQGKTQLQELTLPNKLQTIGNYAFQGCSYLTDKLDIPAGVTSIGDGAFEGTYYTSVNLPSKLNTIGHRAFYNLPIKQKIYLPETLTSIGDEAFAETQIYGVADMKNDIAYLGWGAFRNTQIENMFLPEDHVTSVSWALFQGCSKLGVIGIPKNFTEVSGYAFDGCSGLSYVRMSPNIESIGEYAFQNTQLEYMNVPSKVEVLTWGVFKDCRSLESLSLPADLKQISREALMGCTALRNLSIEAVEPPTVEKNAMLGVNTDRCIISIPSKSFDDYLLADYWGKFVNLRNNIVVESEGNGEIAFESMDEEDDGVSDARRASVRRYIAARARAKTRGAGEEEEELKKTLASDGSSIYVPKNGKVRFYIIPAEAETLQSATLDGVDITNDIKDGVYETTADKKDAKLVVKFSGVAPDATEPITIGKNGKTTYCGDKGLDFSGTDEVKAFIATGFDKTEGTIWMTRVKDVPAGVPVMIKGTANETYHVPVTEGGSSYYKNMFVGNTTGENMSISTTSEDGKYVNYYMSGGLFKSVNGSANIGNNKCYLQLPANFEAETTGEGLQVKIAASGKSSFAAPYDLDFTDLGDDLKAFTATGFDKSTNTIWLTRVKKVQKGEGLMLKGTGGETYTIPSTGIQASYENMIVGNISGGDLIINETSDDGTLTNFYLKGGTYMSVKVTATIGNNKSYLELPTSMLAGAGARSETADDAQTAYDFVEMETESMPIIFGSIGDGDGETTGIQSMYDDSSSMGNDEWYTLNGQRISKPTKKGLYIHNGKKVVIK